MKKVFNLSLLFAALVMIGFASCKPVEPNVAVTGVTVSPTTLSLSVGGTSKLTATVAPSNATNKNVTWASSNTAVATVDASGTVTGVAAGTANITVTTADGKKTATCAVTVTSGGGGTTGTVECEFLGQPAYIGDGSGSQPGKHLYQVAMIPKGTFDAAGNVVKAGTLYVFILSGAAPSGSNFNPATGAYTWAEGYGSMTVSAESSYWRPFDESGSFTAEAAKFTGGTFTVAAEKLSFVGTNSAGAVDVAYSGAYEFINDVVDPWASEPTTARTVTESFDTGKVTDYGDFYQSGTKNLGLFSYIEGQRFLMADFFTTLNATTFTAGTYNVADTKAENTILKSVGMAKGAQLWQASSLFGYANAQGQITEAFFFASGTATVTANQIAFNVTSHFGSTLNLTYTGDMTLHQPQSGAPAYLKSKNGVRIEKTDLRKISRLSR